MLKKRSYEDGCAAAHALDLVGERWALLIVRELFLGPKRFTALRAGLPGISPNVVTQRLSEPEASRLLERRKQRAPVSAWAYELTELRIALAPIMLKLGYWGARTSLFQRGAPLSVEAMRLSS